MLLATKYGARSIILVLALVEGAAHYRYYGSSSWPLRLGTTNSHNDCDY